MRNCAVWWARENLRCFGSSLSASPVPPPVVPHPERGQPPPHSPPLVVCAGCSSLRAKKHSRVLSLFFRSASLALPFTPAVVFPLVPSLHNHYRLRSLPAHKPIF